MNRRLAVPIILLLLFLLAGTVWALFGPLHLAPLAQNPSSEKSLANEGSKPEAPAKTEADSQPQSGTKSSEANPQSPGDAAFDVARIDPNGTSVFAGRTQPGAQVAIIADGKTIGAAKADENGEWTLVVEEKFARTDPKLTLQVKSADELKKEAAAAPPSVPGAGPPASSGEPGAPKAASQAAAPHTANAVTAHLLKDLQGMVNEARSSAQEPSTKPQSAQTGEPETRNVLAAPGTSGPSAGPKTALRPEGAPGAPIVPEPKSDHKDVTAAKLGPPPAGESVRKSIPVPITFIFNEAQFTSDGRKAAELLLEYLKLKSFKKVALTGHADERGSDELNMNLSRDRLQTVAEFLKQGGFSGDLELVPKGKTEPYTGVVRSEYNREELYQLDRRVELVVKP